MAYYPVAGCGESRKSGSEWEGWYASTSSTPTSTTDEQSCAQKAVQTMNWLVEQGEIQTLTGSSSRFRKGNNVIFNVVCSRNSEVRVDVICFNSCDKDTFRLRSRIDALMNW